MRGKRSEKHVKPKEKKKFKYGDSILQALFLVLMSLAAVAAGLSVPGLAAAVQDKRVDKFQHEEQLEPGALSLTSDDKKIARIRLAKELFNESEKKFRLVELERGRFLTENEASDRLRDVLQVTEGTGLYSGMAGDWANLHGEAMLCIPQSVDTTTGLVWIMQSQFSLGGSQCELKFIVDDSSGLVVGAAVHGPMGTMPENRAETLKKLAENLSSYYAFSDTKLVPEGEKELLNSSSDQCCIYFVREGETILELPVTIGDSFWEIG